MQFCEICVLCSADVDLNEVLKFLKLNSNFHLSSSTVPKTESSPRKEQSSIVLINCADGDSGPWTSPSREEAKTRRRFLVIFKCVPDEMDKFTLDLHAG